MGSSCCEKTVKFILFSTNFLVFILGLVTVGFGTWVLVDKPSFLDLFHDAENILNDNNVDISGFNLGIYAGAPIILIIVGVIVAIIAFFGCCGAIKENKCMLITYFVILLAVFIATIVGAVLVLQGKFEDEIKSPLVDSMKYYKDQSDKPEDKAFKEIWNTIQSELRCCGVNNATDWKIANEPNWSVPSQYGKPAGCCKYTRGQDAENNEAQIEDCRKADYNSNSKYYFEGCYTAFIDEIESQQDKIFAAAIATVVIMFINMLSSFAMCTMSG